MKNIKNLNTDNEIHILQPGKEYLIESIGNEGYPFEIYILEITKKTLLFYAYEDMKPIRMTFFKFFEKYNVVEELEDEDECCGECIEEDDDLNILMEKLLDLLDELELEFEIEDEVDTNPYGTGTNPYIFEPDPENPITVTYTFTITS